MKSRQAIRNADKFPLRKIVCYRMVKEGTGHRGDLGMAEFKLECGHTFVKKYSQVNATKSRCHQCGEAELSLHRQESDLLPEAQYFRQPPRR